METYSSIYQTQVEGYTYSYADPESFYAGRHGHARRGGAVLYAECAGAGELDGYDPSQGRRRHGCFLADDTTQSLPAGPYDSAAYAIGIDGYTFRARTP